MSNRITLDELKTYLWNSAVLLRSSIDAGAYKQYIFPLLFFKRMCDVYDEESAKVLAENDGNVEALDWPESHSFVIPKGVHWNDVRSVSENVGVAIVNAFQAIERANIEKLGGVFGNAAWTNKNRLPDALLKNLIEHFSSKTLSLANCPEDELGQGYEYLIKKFADDAGHTAQEFYTNRTVVHLMTEMLKPQSGESIYDPTCGSAGMLISSVAYLKSKGQEWRNVKIYGQEINQLTSAIARMNLFLHGIEDFQIINDDTLQNPRFIEYGKLQTFDVVLANPPYSIKQWDRASFEHDKWGRNEYGTPPQSRADYAFIQHILKSMNKNGRCAILLPHGVLNRKEEEEIRQNIIATDCVDAVIGLGRHLFYNSGMESCILICKNNKPVEHKGKVLFINAENCIHKKSGQNYLFDEDISKIVNAYKSEQDIDNFSKHVSIKEILSNNGNLNIKLYVGGVDEKLTQESGIGDKLDEYLMCVDNFHAAVQSFINETNFFFENKQSYVDFNFKKSEWKRVCLADVAEEYSERVENPSLSEYDWYIGSDCIDRFDFKINRKTPASKITSAQKLFKTGDYLFVRRSLYGSDFRERCPMADFNGICSADILTIREKPDVIEKGFLIAILYSKAMWNFVVANSTGSLTRRVKWQQLKTFEFLLPPRDIQKFISNLLWTAEEIRQAYKKLIKQTDDLVKAKFEEMFYNKNYPFKTIGEVIDKNIKRTTKVFDADDIIKYLDISSIDNSTNTVKGLTNYRVKDAPSRAQNVLQENDILYSTVRPNLKNIAINPYKGNDIVGSSGFCVLRCTGVPTLYMYAVVTSDEFTNAMVASASGANYPAVTDKIVHAYSIPIPPEREQIHFVEFLQQAEQTKLATQQSLDALNEIVYSLVNTNF